MDRGRRRAGWAAVIGSFVVVFREILEAALVVGVVTAAANGLPHRGRWVGVGVGLGVAGAMTVAAGIGEISRFAEGNGQALFAAAVLFAAGLMLAWHNIWMAEHGRAMTSRLKALGTDVLSGRESLVMLVCVTALAVMREGSEIALFLYGIAVSGGKDAQLLGGSLLGLAAGVAAGFVLFAGLSRIPVKRLFEVSALLILFIAAGMIARAAAFLVQAGFLPPLVPRVWDTSALISGNGIVGRSLAALVGYTPAPSLLQVLFWIGSFALIGGFMLAKSERVRTRRGSAAGTAVIAAAFVAVGLFRPGQASGYDYQVYSPHVVRGEREVESRAFTSRGTSEQSGAEKGFKLAYGHALTNHWATEVYLVAEQEFAETLKLEELEWENRFQLTPQGKNWLDVGLLNEIEIPRFGHDPYQISFGPTLEKDIGHWTALLDVLVLRQYGTDAESGFGLEYRAHIEYRLRRSLSPFFEAFGEPANRFGGPARHQAGPGVTGQIPVGPGRSIRYGVKALFGVSRAAPDATLVLRAEYEFR
jgi:high-affinity iron transporter